MARKELYATRAMRYGTRMLQAGQPVELDGPKARLFEALDWAGPSARVKTEKTPKQAREPKPSKKDGASKPKRCKARKAKSAK